MKILFQSPGVYFVFVVEAVLVAATVWRRTVVTFQPTCAVSNKNLNKEKQFVQ